MALAKKTKKQKLQTVNILYQKLGHQWFAFSQINNEVFFAPIPKKRIQALQKAFSFQNLHPHAKKVA